MTKSDWADYSKTFECKKQEKFKIDVYIEIHESLNFLQRRRNRGFFNNLAPDSCPGYFFVQRLAPCGMHSKIQAYLYRERTSDQGTEGVLSVPEIGFSCFTLELPWRGNEPNISCILAGAYPVDIRVSPRFGKVYHVQNVPSRSWILTHSGNLAGDVSLGFRSNVEGCILLGSKRGVLFGQRAVLASRMTVRRFMKAMREQPLHMQIHGVV